jgi:hypothetical protein
MDEDFERKTIKPPRCKLNRPASFGRQLWKQSPLLLPDQTDSSSKFYTSLSTPPNKEIGCDFSGLVTSLGSAVDRDSFAPGDCVAGIIHGCHYSLTAAFALEHLVAKV